MPLRFLIVHESLVITNIVRKYILADHTETVIDSDNSPESAVKTLKEIKYDLVFSGLEMSGMTGLDIREQMRMSGVNQETPFVIMTPSDDEARRMKLSGRDIQHVLPIPFTSIQFRSLLCQIFHPQVRAIDAAYNIPRSRAAIRIGSRQIPADVINISADSIICELIPPGELADLKKATQITVHFPIDYGKALVIDMTGALLGSADQDRLEKKSSLQRIRTAWKIKWEVFELKAATKKPLKMFFGQEPVPDSDPDFVQEIETISAINESVIKDNEILRAKLDKLNQEKKELSRQLERLEREISDIRKLGAHTPIKDISLSALINEVARRSDDPSKVKIFKRIIDDNVKLRKELSNN
jgi:CheY-like chemotaxis protein